MYTFFLKKKNKKVLSLQSESKSPEDYTVSPCEIFGKSFNWTEKQKKSFLIGFDPAPESKTKKKPPKREKRLV